MAVTQYIGARYVPIFAAPIEWSPTKTYDPLTIVMHQGNSFTSRQFVPIGVDINNTNFWAETGNYNAQVEQYRQEVLNFADSIVEKAFAFDTVADMQTSDELYAGAICHTNGFHANGDGGAAWYIINSTGPANGMDILACANDFYAHLISNCVTPEMMGAHGDGVHNDLPYLQRACTYDNIKCKANAIYAITLQNENTDFINCHNNMQIDLNGATIKILPHTLNSYRLFNIRNDADTVENISIVNGYIYGDKNTHTHIGSEQGGFAIRIGRNAKNITITNMSINDMYGDGIYIGTGTESNNDIPENITVTNCKIKNALRNGISVTNGINVFLDNIYISETSGQNPMAGIDFEPNWNTDIIKAYLGSIIVENQSGCVTISNYASATLELYADNIFGKNIDGMYIRLDTDSIVNINNLCLIQAETAERSIVLNCETTGAAPCINNLNMQQNASSASRPIIGLQSNDSKINIGNLEIVGTMTFPALVTNRACDITIHTLNTNNNKLTGSINNASLNIGKIIAPFVVITDANETDFIGLQTVIYSDSITEQKRISINGSLHCNLDKITFINNNSAISGRVTFSNCVAPDGTTNLYIPANTAITIQYIKSIQKWVQV